MSLKPNVCFRMNIKVQVDGVFTIVKSVIFIVVAIYIYVVF